MKIIKNIQKIKLFIPLPTFLLLSGLAFTVFGQTTQGQDQRGPEQALPPPGTESVLPPHESDNSTTVVPPSILNSLLDREPENPLSSEPLRVIESNDNRIGLYVLSSNTSDAERPATGGYHRHVSEVYHVINGTGIFLTGGQIENPEEVRTGTTRYQQSGPGATGTMVNGNRIQYGPGTRIIVPPGTPHNAFYRVDTPTDYIIYRFDPNKFLDLQ